jgi:hypothetical protein
MTNHDLSLGDTLRLIRSEYLEIPGLHLTRRQVERLWRLDTPSAESLLRVLVDVQFLRATRTGAYVRASHDEEARHRRPAERAIHRQPQREMIGAA